MMTVHLILWLLLPSVVAHAITVPAGTEAQLRLMTAVSTDAAKTPESIEAVVIAPVIAGNNVVVIPSGVRLYGKVAERKPAERADTRAVLDLAFSEIASAQKKRVSVKTRLIDVDNARESVDDAGRIIGILASETLAARMEHGITKVGERNAALGGLLNAAKSAVFKEPPSGEIRYEAGTELKLRILELFEWEPSEAAALPGPVEDEKALYELVNAQPFQTMAESPRKPSDVTNLMFVGTEEQLRETFRNAGWDVAHELNTESMLETVRAVAGMRGYKEAPMSRLLLESKRSDFDFQKQNNTFAKRHHLRIWRRPVPFEGKPVWVCSATHDIGIAFSEENRTFIHLIDSEIDRERAKVVSDLLFTSRVKALALVDRPAVPRKTKNATGDEVVTDGRMAVLVLE
jgi:hypothetical protein